MCVALANNVNAGGVIVFAALKSVNNTGGDALRTEHNGHCRREVFAVSLANVEQKICERVAAASLLFERIPEFVLKVRFNDPSCVVPI